MALNGSSRELGPLPESDRNAELQRSSIKALNAMLQGQDTIVFRDERVEDYGVDGAFELMLHGGMTNFRSQVQIKATEAIRSNRDNTISLSVRTANLNYLLNGTSPIYVLFDATKNEFWYAWAHDENRRLTTENPSWREQREITLRFSQRLTTGRFDQIVDRVLREGRMQRTIHDTLARATANDHVVISIDPQSLAISDPAHAQHVLLASGPSLVAAGFPSEALRMLGLIPESVKNLPRLQLTAGYAEYMLGKHFNALGHIRQALSRRKELSERDVRFLEGLKDATEFNAGLIDSANYRQRAKQRSESLQGVESLEARLEELRHRHLTEPDRGTRSWLAEQIRAVAEEMREHPDATDAMKLSAQLASLFVEGTEASAGVAHQLGLARMRAMMGVANTDEMQGAYKAANNRVAQWEVLANSTLKTAYDLRHPILIGDAICVVLGIRLFQLVNRKFDAIYCNADFKVPVNVFSSLLDTVAKGQGIYELNGVIEGSLRIKMLKADLLELAGDLSGAKEIASDAHPIAEAMSFATIAKWAKDILDDKTTVMEFEREWLAFMQTDRDVSFSELTDNQVRQYARDSLDSDGLPATRLDVIEQYIKSLRDVSRERVDWCRHILLLEDLRQTGDPGIAFTVLPNRKCVCDKLGYQTKIITSEAHSLISAFKQQFCASCKDRSPKRSP